MIWFVLIVILVVVIYVLYNKSRSSKNSNKSNSNVQKNNGTSGVSKPKPVTSNASKAKTPAKSKFQTGSEEWFFEVTYNESFGLENSNKAFADHPLALSKLDVRTENNKQMLLTISVSTAEILKDIVPSGLTHGILPKVLNFDDIIISKLKQNVSRLDRRLTDSDMAFGDFLKSFDCKTYGEVAALQRVCTIKLAKAGIMDAGPKDTLNSEYKGLIGALESI